MSVPIPDDIVVEEQYSDLLRIIDGLLPHFEGFELDNHDPVGRLKGELLYIQQEVKAKKFPIPGTEASVSTCYSLAGDPMFPKGFPNIKKELYAIVSIVTCRGLLKERHYPRIIELVCEVIDQIDRLVVTDKEVIDKERDYLYAFASELRIIAKRLHQKTISLPLEKNDWPHFRNPNGRADFQDRHDKYYLIESKIKAPLISRWRPRQSQPTEGWSIPDWVKEPLEEMDGKIS